MYDHKRDRCRRGMVQRTRIFPTQISISPKSPTIQWLDFEESPFIVSTCFNQKNPQVFLHIVLSSTGIAAMRGALGAP